VSCEGAWGVRPVGSSVSRDERVADVAKIHLPAYTRFKSAYVGIDNVRLLYYSSVSWQSRDYRPTSHAR
jgi:hypothetical protein